MNDIKEVVMDDAFYEEYRINIAKVMKDRYHIKNLFDTSPSIMAVRNFNPALSIIEPIAPYFRKN